MKQIYSVVSYVCLDHVITMDPPILPHVSLSCRLQMGSCL